MTTAEMRRTKAKAGYWFVNVAALGKEPDWREQVEPIKSPYLFGYLPSDLIAKQYK